MPLIPDHLWRRGARQAERALRSGLRLGVGCVIFDPRTGRVAAQGCSHIGGGAMAQPSTHAEVHALRSTGDVDGQWALLVGLRADGAATASARPCAACARRLERAGVRVVVFFERDEHDDWTLRREGVADLVGRAQHLPSRGYAREMKIPRPKPARERAAGRAQARHHQQRSPGRRTAGSKARRARSRPGALIAITA